VLDQFGPARVMEAGGEAIDQADSSIRRTKQQRAGFRGDRPTIERRLHPAALDTGESK
jgi:hypothetical protein